MRCLCFLLLLTSTGPAQNILYNEARDKTAQDTVAAAKQITGSTITATQLKNLEQIEKDLIEAETAWTETSLKRNLNGFRRWDGIKIIVDTVDDLVTLDSTASNAGDLAARQKEIQDSIDKLRSQAAAAKAAKESPLVTETILARVGQAQDLLDMGSSAIKSMDPQAGQKEFAAAGEALGQLKQGVEQVNALVTTVRGIAQAAAGVRVDPNSLAPSPVSIQMELLATETDYLKALAVIRARRSLDKREVLQMIREYRLRAGNLGVLDSTERIDETLRQRAAPGDTNAKVRVEETLEPLLLAAAIAARQDSSERIWGMREAVEYRRWQIRRSAIYNGSYESALQAASQRLAAYYASGFKSSQLAQMLYQLGNAFALPYLVVTK